ncbi:MAG: O-antigen ligase family protein [Kiritimatiellia bacterium]
MNGRTEAIAGSGSSSLEEWCYRTLALSVWAIAFSIALGEVLLALTFVLFVAALVKEHRPPAFSVSSLLAVLFVIVAVVTALRGTAPERSADALTGLIWLASIFVTATMVNTHRRLTILLKAFSVGCGVLALEICVLRPINAFLAVRAGESAGRGLLDEIINRGSMTDGQMLVAGIIAVLGVIYTARTERKRYGGWIVLLAILAAGMIVNFKRGSWICACVAAAGFMAAKGNWKYLFVGALIAAAAALLPPVRYRLSSISSDSRGRIVMWTKAAPGLMREHPWGVGYGALNNEMMRRHAPNVEPDRNHLHSNIFQILVETGWPGLGVWSLWMAVVLIESLRFCRKGDSIEESIHPTLDPVLTVLTPEERFSAGSNNALVLLFVLLGLLMNGLIEYNFGDTEIMVVYSFVMGCVIAGNRR